MAHLLKRVVVVLVDAPMSHSLISVSDLVTFWVWWKMGVVLLVSPLNPTPRGDTQKRRRSISRFLKWVVGPERVLFPAFITEGEKLRPGNGRKWWLSFWVPR